MRKILLVEDDPLVIRLMEMTLGSVACRLEIATTFHGGRRSLDAASYDLVLLDVSLPGGSGFDLARHIRSSGDDRTLILMLTALRQDNSRDRGLACGADAYMTKPFSPGAVRHRIERLLAKDCFRTTVPIARPAAAATYAELC
ncbi:MAG: response regulator transcription factor [Candidatus Dormibacteria bacterium]